MGKNKNKKRKDNERKTNKKIKAKGGMVTKMNV